MNWDRISNWIILILSKILSSKPTTPVPPTPVPPTPVPPTPVPPTPVPPTPVPPTPPTPGDVRVLQLIDEVNVRRSVNSLKPFALSFELHRAAQKHSVWQDANNTMSHVGENRSSVGDRVLQEEYRWSRVGEVVAAGYPSVVSVVDAWMKSAGHRAILLGNFTDAGFGVSSGHWTGVFGTRVSVKMLDDNVTPHRETVPDLYKDMELCFGLLGPNAPSDIKVNINTL